MTVTEGYLHDFTNKFEAFLQKRKRPIVEVHGEKAPTGLLFLGDTQKNSKTFLIRTSASWRPLNVSKIEKFIYSTDYFKGLPVNNYVYIASAFSKNARLYARKERRITLVEVKESTKQIFIHGTKNIGPGILKELTEFASVFQYDLSYDFEGSVQHTGLKGKRNKPVVEVQSQMQNPKVFFSYSWDDEKHKLWVLKLASDLIKSGIDVLIDEWDLDRYHNDLHVFMETGIRDSDKVVMICTPKYAQKVNARKGGVGVESTIITGEFYDTEKASKYIPIVKNYRNSIHECLPSYLKSKYSLDFNKEPDYKHRFDDLIRKILSVPKYKKPELGKLPKLRTREI